MLNVSKIYAGYGGKAVLNDVCLEVRDGEIVAIIGANGAGKSTLINAISGVLPITVGTVTFSGAVVSGKPMHAVARRGLIQVPEGRQVFAPLTVMENIELGAEALGPRGRTRTEDLERVFALFPKLADRIKQKAGSLSGGEQQMLAIARALMGRPSMLLLDEPSLGLAPVIIARLFDTLAELNRSGLTMLVIEQNAQRALDLASRAYVLERGRVVREGASSELRNDPGIRASYLGGE